MSAMDTWRAGSHSHAGITHRTYRKGEGPGVVLVHEIPGITPRVLAFAEEVVSSGFTVVLPELFGTAGVAPSPTVTVRALGQVCVSREFHKLATGRTAPIADWLRSLARGLHDELGGPGVGALGMCFTGGFALGMMVDPSVTAPVLAQPSVPFALTPARRADLDLSPEDLAVVKARCSAGQQVLGVRYRDDPAVGTRFTTLHRELGDAFLRVELPGRRHSTLTEHRDQEAVDRVLEFLHAQLG